MNNQLIAEGVELTKSGTQVPLTLDPGENQLTIAARNVGTVDPANTVRVQFRGSDLLFGDANFSGNLQPNQVIGRTIGLPKVEIDGTRSPYAADHINDNPTPQILTVKRQGSGSRRRANTRAYRAENGLTPSGFDIDEVPPAKTAEGAGGTASTRAIPLSDNRSGGGQFGRLINAYDGEELADGTNIDFGATAADYTSPNNIELEGLPELVPLYSRDVTAPGVNAQGKTIVGSINENNLIYGSSGPDIIRGEGTRGAGTAQGGDDILLGDGGNDRMGGKGGNDDLLGQAGNDLLYGDKGDDLLYGGPGTDTLFGDDQDVNFQGKDTFAIRRNEGADLIADFDANDRIALLDGLKYSNLSFKAIRNGNLLSLEEIRRTPSPQGTPIDFPDFPGPIKTIVSGIQISNRSNNQVLAYVNSPLLEALAEPRFYVEQPGGSGKFTLDNIPPIV